MASTSLLAPFLSAGFYYKTFMWPAAFWEKVYEPLIRRAAGLGRAARLPDPDRYEKACRALRRAGRRRRPGGLTAALAAGRAGARVILCEEDFRLGGRLLCREPRPSTAAPRGMGWRSAEAELAALPDVRILPRTTVFGVYDHGTYGAVERVSDHLPAPPAHEPRQRLWRIVAKRCVLAAGAIERPMVFAGNDRPGVMLAGAVAHLSQPLRRGAGPRRRGVRHRRRQPAHHRRTPRGRHRDRRAHRCPAEIRRRPQAGRRRGRRARLCRGRGHAGAWPWRGAGRRRRHAALGSTTRRVRPAGDVGRLDAHDPPHLPSRRQAGMGRHARPPSSRRIAARHERGGRGHRPLTLASA